MVFVFVYVQYSSWELNWTQLNICMWLGVCFIITLSIFIASLTAKVSRQSHRFSHCMHLIRILQSSSIVHFRSRELFILMKWNPFFSLQKHVSSSSVWINAHFLLPMASFSVCETHFIMWLYSSMYLYMLFGFWSFFWVFLLPENNH